jgi:hypothetical protein
LYLRLKSGNREVIEDAPPKTSTAVPTEKKEAAIPFQKPVSLLPVNMRTTPIKETVEKHTHNITEKESNSKSNLQEIYIENKNIPTDNNITEIAKNAPHHAELVSASPTNEEIAEDSKSSSERNDENFIGTSTEESILTGITHAIEDECNGIIERYTCAFDRLKIILTGGDAQLFKNKIKNEIFVIDHLVLVGLNVILNYNVEN